jgi:carbamoyltransferase
MTKGRSINILGINAYHGDVSAVLVRDGELVAAVEEERFRRIKHIAGFPREAILACLDMAGVTPQEIDHVAVSRNPRANLFGKAWFALRSRPGGGLIKDRATNYRRVNAIPETIAEALGLKAGDRSAAVHWVEHHPAHLASAFFVSPFEEAAVCAIDGFGDFVSTSWAIGRGSSMKVIHRTFFPHSLGLLYLAITQYLGFNKFGDEFKVMGLAPYGSPDFVQDVRQLVRLVPGGQFELNLPFFRHWSEGAGMTWDDGAPVLERVFTSKLEDLLGPARTPDEPVTARHEAIAASLQVVFEDAAFHVLNGVHEQTKMTRLCLAGGCAMNSVANGKIRERTPFEEVYVQPASGDNGTALGAAYWVWNQVLNSPRHFVMQHGYWGPSFQNAQIDEALAARTGDMTSVGCDVRTFEDSAALCDWTAARIAEGLVIGWFQGRMEWGARALGNRSILADPRRADMREIINTKIKFREKFRPFAPSVLVEKHAEYFEDSVPDPFMLQVYPIRPEKRDVIPAVTHVDGSGRLQTVSRESNPLYWELIRAFERRTGVPIVLNTSFNENEPIVLRPAEALDCFLRTRMDVLVLGNRVVTKVSPGVGGKRPSDLVLTAEGQGHA